MAFKNLFIYLIISYVLYPIIQSIFSVPDLTKTSNKINTYMIDFIGIETPPATYWSLANYHLDMTDFEKTHSNVTGGELMEGFKHYPMVKKLQLSLFGK